MASVPVGATAVQIAVAAMGVFYLSTHDHRTLVWTSRMSPTRLAHPSVTTVTLLAHPSLTAVMNSKMMSVEASWSIS